MATLDLSKIGNSISTASPLQLATPTAITSTNTQATPQVNLTPKPDTTNYAGILASAQQQALAIQQQIAGMTQQQQAPAPQPQPQQQAPSIMDYIKSIEGVQQPSATQTYSDLRGQSGLDQQQEVINQKAQLTTEAQARLNNISAQIQALNAEATAVPIQLQQDSEGRGRTAGGIAPLQADELRKIALRAIPLEIQAYTAQAEVANAQGQQQLAQDLYTQAENTLNRQFELQMQDADRQYEYKTNLIEKVYEYADREQQRELDSIKLKSQQEFEMLQDDIAYQRQIERDKLLNNQDIARIRLQNQLSNQGSSGTGSTLDGKPQNATQSTANSYANRLNEANVIISNLGSQFTGALAGIPLPNILKSGDRQAYEQAQKNFITAVLRRESGAAIAESEFETARDIYFPVAGDGPDVVAQKEQTRNTVINNFYREANVNRPVLPGQIIESEGVRYRVGTDGVTLEKI